MGSLTLEDSIQRFKEKFRKSAKISEKGKRYIPGGYSKTSATFGNHVIYVDHGDGQYIYTSDGHCMLDFHNNFAVNVIGHNHARVREALLTAITDGFSFANPMEYEHRLAELLCKRFKAIERIIFSCSASESCLTAVRIARANTAKQKIAKFEGGYHGIADEFLISLHPNETLSNGSQINPFPVSSSAGIPEHEST